MVTKKYIYLLSFGNFLYSNLIILFKLVLLFSQKLHRFSKILAVPLSRLRMNSFASTSAYTHSWSQGNCRQYLKCVSENSEFKGEMKLLQKFQGLLLITCVLGWKSTFFFLQQHRISRLQLLQRLISDMHSPLLNC